MHSQLDRIHKSFHFKVIGQTLQKAQMKFVASRFPHSCVLMGDEQKIQNIDSLPGFPSSRIITRDRWFSLSNS